MQGAGAARWTPPAAAAAAVVAVGRRTAALLAFTMLIHCPCCLLLRFERPFAPFDPSRSACSHCMADGALQCLAMPECLASVHMAQQSVCSISCIVTSLAVHPARYRGLPHQRHQHRAVARQPTATLCSIHARMHARCRVDHAHARAHRYTRIMNGHDAGKHVRNQARAHGHALCMSPSASSCHPAMMQPCHK